MALLQVLEQRRGAERRLPLQSRHHFAVPDLGKRVLACAPGALCGCPRDRLPRFDAPPCALGQARFRAGQCLSVALLSVCHV
jgi:hypothetical protein